jgi:hypothetical protein
MRGLISIALLSLLPGCGAVDAVGAAARVVATGVEVTGSVVGATVDVVGSAASGAVDLATGSGETQGEPTGGNENGPRANDPGASTSRTNPQTAVETAPSAR